jgi:hypothetical protein
MNVFGIDYQRTLSVISLREGRNANNSPHSVGDGLRTLIPNTVLGDKLWGSRALLSVEPGRLSGSETLADGPWLDEPGASLFWRGLYRRLFSYIGRVRPTMQEGYRVVVSIQAADYQAAAEDIKQLCHIVGLNNTACIPATDALLCRWMAEQSTNEEREHLVTAIAVGDTSVLIRAYRVQCETGRFPRIVAAGQPVHLVRAGLAWWVTRVLELVHARFNEPIPLGHELALRDAVIEFGTQLGRTYPSREIEWTGLFRERMYAPVKVTLQDCKSWPEVASLHLALPAAIRDTSVAAGGGTKPDLVVLGGVGAVWPFTRSVIAAAEPKLEIWQSDNPLEDVSCGATWWPLVGEAYMDQLQQESRPAPSRAAEYTNRTARPSVEPPDVGIDSDTDVLPPWKRRGSLDL